MFSKSAVDEFIKNAENAFTYPSQPYNEWALSFELAPNDGDNIVPNKLGLMLFGDHADDILTQTILK